MSKFWRIGTPDDDLAYYAMAPDRGTAIKLVEALTGPFNPSRVQCTELARAPAGYLAPEAAQCLLYEDPDYEG